MSRGLMLDSCVRVHPPQKQSVDILLLCGVHHL